MIKYVKAINNECLPWGIKAGDICKVIKYEPLYIHLTKSIMAAIGFMAMVFSFQLPALAI